MGLLNDLDHTLADYADRAKDGRDDWWDYDPFDVNFQPRNRLSRLNDETPEELLIAGLRDAGFGEWEARFWVAAARYATYALINDAVAYRRHRIPIETAVAYHCAGFLPDQAATLREAGWDPVTARRVREQTGFDFTEWVATGLAPSQVSLLVSAGFDLCELDHILAREPLESVLESAVYMAALNTWHTSEAGS